MAGGFATIGLSLLAALSWGGSDFMGGLASKRHPVIFVTMMTELAGILAVAEVELFLREPFLTLPECAWAGGAGLSGVVAVVCLYWALATDKMGVVAPLCGVLMAGVAAVLGMATEGLPGPWQLAGFGLALAGVWLLSNSRVSGLKPQTLVWALVAGLSGGLFFFATRQASYTSAFWPNLVERAVGLGLLLVVGVFWRPALNLKQVQWPVLAGLGLLDTAGAVLFTMAARAGRLDVATVVSSLYPGGTVLLAWGLLRERLAPLQWLGIALALAAIALIVI